MSRSCAQRQPYLHAVLTAAAPTDRRCPRCPRCPPRPGAAATAFAAVVDAVGASSNYWLSRWLLRDVVAGLFPARVHAFALEVRGQAAARMRAGLAGNPSQAARTCGGPAGRPANTICRPGAWLGARGSSSLTHRMLPPPASSCPCPPCHVRADAEAPGQPAQLQPVHPHGAHLPQARRARCAQRALACCPCGASPAACARSPRASSAPCHFAR